MTTDELTRALYYLQMRLVHNGLGIMRNYRRALYYLPTCDCYKTDWEEWEILRNAGKEDLPCRYHHIEKDRHTSAAYGDTAYTQCYYHNPQSAENWRRKKKNQIKHKIAFYYVKRVKGLYFCNWCGQFKSVACACKQGYKYIFCTFIALAFHVVFNI